MNHLDAFWRSNSYYRESWIRRKLRAIPAGMRILDAGCGGQPYRKYCQHLNYSAQDFAKLDARNQLVGGQYGPLDFECDITSIPAPDCSFDAVLCSEVLEHVPDPLATITELARLLRPGGFLILTAPLGSFLHQEPYHYYGGYTPYWYEHFLPKAGLQLREIEQNGGMFRFLGQECQRVTRVVFRGRPMAVRIPLLPIEAVSWVLLTIAVPTVCHIADRLFPTRGITIGYHILAERE